MNQEKYDELMRNYSDLTRDIKVLKETKAELRTELLILLKTDNITEVQNDNFALNLTTSSRRDFDKEKALEFLEKNNEDIEDYYEQSDYETLKVIEKTSEAKI